MKTLSEQEKQKVVQLLSHSSTRCVGVYLIDLPNAFKPDKQMSFLYQYNNAVKISTQQQYLPPFKQMIAQREQELKATKPVDLNDSPFLKAIYPLKPNNSNNIHGIIFERMEDIGMPDVARILEGYRWKEEVTLKIELTATNGLAEKYAKDRQKHPDIYSYDVPQKLNELSQLFDRIQVREDLTIPTEPGVCLLHSFMTGTDNEWKEINYSYSHESIEDFMFGFSSDDYAPDYALLDKPEAYFTEYEGKTVYKGKRETNGLKLEEWIVKGKYFTNEADRWGEKDEGYIFTLGIHMTDPTPTTPKLVLTMYYKIPDDDRGYNKNELMVIWREITDSIKMRPGAFEKIE